MLELLSSLLKRALLRQDLANHFVWALVLLVVVGSAFGFVFGLAAAAAVTIAKDLVWDWALGRGTPDPRDVLSGFAAIACAYVVYLMGAFEQQAGTVFLLTKLFSA